MSLRHSISRSRVPTPRTVLAASLLAGALSISAGCGGKVVAGAEESNGACDCGEGEGCPAGDACGSYACEACRCVLQPKAEGTPCPDGFCDGAGACFTRAQICARACQYIPGCMTSTPEECNSFCFDDLSDCSSAQMYQTDVCTSETLTPVCKADEWIACLTPVGCLATDAPQ